MEPQVFNWTCSVCSFQWVINALSSTPTISREEALGILGYPYCVNPTYGLMTTQCMLDGFSSFELRSVATYATFDQAYAIANEHTGTINPQGMYHFMALRGVQETPPALYVANSAPGYRGVWNILDRSQFNALGPVELVYLPDTRST